MRTARLKRTASGITLLEVMLAVAILGMSLTAIGELVRMGVSSALAARDLTRAQVYAESKMAELTSGMLPLDSVSLMPYELDPTFLYQIAVEPGMQEGMQQVVVQVTRDPVQGGRELHYSLYRWVVDPEAETLLEQDNATILENSTQGTTEDDTSGL